jgi:hypothetical protein
MTTWYARDDAAERAGVEVPYLTRLVDLGILTPDAQGRFSGGDVRRALMATSLERAGIPLDAVAAAVQRGAVSLDFLDTPAYERFAALSGETFGEVSERTGIPFELLTVIRESIGMAEPSPDDRLREDEAAILPFVELQLASGFRPTAIERLLRVQGESTRRIAEQEAAWWRSEVIEPGLAAGESTSDRDPEFAEQISPMSEQTMLAMYHAQRRVPDGKHHRRLRAALGDGGIHSRLERQPAICFLDISGYTAHPGARRRCRGRARIHGRPAGAADLRPARRQAHQMARRRRDVPLRGSGSRRARGPRDGERVGDRGTPPGACRLACRTRALPTG